MIYGKSSYACCVQPLLMLWKVEQTVPLCSSVGNEVFIIMGWYLYSTFKCAVLIYVHHSRIVHKLNYSKGIHDTMCNRICEGLNYFVHLSEQVHNAKGNSILINLYLCWMKPSYNHIL